LDAEGTRRKAAECAQIARKIEVFTRRRQRAKARIFEFAEAALFLITPRQSLAHIL
jgi:hypothetical protein